MPAPPSPSFWSSLSDGVGPAFATTVGAGVALLLAIAKKWFDERRENLKHKKQSNFAYLAEKQVHLDQFVQRMCDTLGCDHVALYRFHNGEYFIDGDSIKKMSMVAEATSHRALARWKSRSQNVLLSGWPKMILGVTNNPRHWLQRGEESDYEAGKAMSDRGYESSLCMLASGRKQRPLAVLSCSWCDERQDDSAVPAAKLAELMRELTYLLED